MNMAAAKQTIATTTVMANRITNVSIGSRPLLYIVAQRLAGRSVHEMHLAACQTGHRLVGLAIVRGDVVSELCLHVLARGMASEDHGRHETF
jgi:hypothetical protein